MMGRYAPIVVALIAMLGTIVSAWLQTSQVNELQGQGVGSLTEGQKVCRVHKHGHFIDSIIVPKVWTPLNCAQYAKKNDRTKAGALHYSLGCVYSDNVYFGDDLQVNSPNDARKPAKDCGWY
jgi:hypothetical protein